MNAPAEATPAVQLGGLSLAEHEYAHKFFDHLSLGEPRPDASGFDAVRVRVIESTLRDVFNTKMRDRFRRRR